MSKKKRENFLFNFIAPVYGLFFNSQKKHYLKSIEILEKHINIDKCSSIIDIGCGTGALCAALYKEGMVVTGIDPAIKMLNIAKRKNRSSNINFIECSTCEKLPFENDSFDISVASYVAHGIQYEERKVLYTEMSRLSKHYVIFYDYNETRAFLTDVVEWLEGGDYFNFIKTVKVELKDFFESIEEIKLDKRASWYICKPHK
jgi:ubiquinone/menaquinone biosynthesis C-methylase UbiE